MISNGEFELLDDVLCGVDANPRRVKMARAAVARVRAELEVYKDFARKIEDDMETLKASVSFAGLCFLFDADKMAHEEIHSVLENLEEIERDASGRVR